MSRSLYSRGAMVTATIAQAIPEAGLLVQLADGRLGFIHISELMYPLAQYGVGKQLNARVVDDNPETERAALTLAIDWRRLQAGQAIQGRVLDVKDRIVFVDIGAEINASIHISHLADTFITHPNTVVQEGQMIQARVLEVKTAERRISLTLKKNI